MAEEGQLGPDDQSTLGDTDSSRGGYENFPKMGNGGQFSRMDTRRSGGCENFPKMDTGGQFSRMDTSPSGGRENFSKKDTDEGERSQSRMDTFSSLGSGKASGLIRPRWE